MTNEDHLMFLTAQVIASQVRPLDIEVTDDRDFSVKAPEEGLVSLPSRYLVGLLIHYLWRKGGGGGGGDSN